jgi:phosphopantothenoylcysteine decarboxylase/phosphopantothenate--cysteine ligase
MASLTIRKLDETVKAYLRLRSAKNGRSVEEEVRVILGELVQGRQEFTAAPSHAVLPSADPQSPTRWRAGPTGQPRVTLIIGGGIAAYKALDLIRRLKERHIHVRCVLTRAAQQFVTPLAASALSNERCYTDLFDPESEFDAGHIRLARYRGPDGKDGAGSCRRPRQRYSARGQPADPAGAGDESADVE